MFTFFKPLNFRDGNSQKLHLQILIQNSNTFDGRPVQVSVSRYFFSENTLKVFI